MLSVSPFTKLAVGLAAMTASGCAQPIGIETVEMSSKEVARMVAGLKSKDAIFIWDGTSELAMIAHVTDSVTHKPISGATVEAVRVGGRNTEPLTDKHSAAMPLPQKTGRDGSARLVAYFRAAGDAEGFCVFVGDSFLHVDAPGYHPKKARISPIVRLDFARKTKHCEVTIPVALTRR
jgi:hypothetical protein